MGAIRALWPLLGLLLPVLLGGAPARAEDAAQFYSAHKLTIGVPNGAGGLYDIQVRALAKYLGKFIPGNPTIIVQDVPAAGGMALTNQLFNTVPHDGSYIAMVRGSTIQEQLYRNAQVQFDARQLQWLGNLNSDYDSCVMWGTSGIARLADFYSHEIIVGASGVGAQSYTFPIVYRELLGMRFKVIAGYPGTPERLLAMERGELSGACGVTTASYRSQMSELAAAGKIRMVAQAGIHKDPRFPDIPNILDEAKNPETRQALEFLYLSLALGRNLAAPPGVPADRVEALRRGLWRAMTDRDFLEEAARLKLDVEASDAATTVRMVDQLFAIPPSVIRRIEAALPQQ